MKAVRLPVRILFWGSAHVWREEAFTHCIEEQGSVRLAECPFVVQVFGVREELAAAWYPHGVSCGFCLVQEVRGQKYHHLWCEMVQQVFLLPVRTFFEVSAGLLQMSLEGVPEQGVQMCPDCQRPAKEAYIREVLCRVFFCLLAQRYFSPKGG